MLTRSQMDAVLEAAYAKVPAIPDCDGSCWTSCGPVPMAGRERQRLRQAGYKITPDDIALRRRETFWCEALTSDKRCGAYAVRPLICRIWGAAEGMPCPRGCIPEGGRMRDEDAFALIAEVMNACGGEHMPAPGAVQAAMASAAGRRVAARELARIRAADAARAANALPPAYRRQG